MNSKISSFISKLKLFNKNYKEKKYRLVAYNNVFNSKYLFLTHFTSNKMFFDSPYREIFLNYFLNAEKKYPGSSKLLSEMIVDTYTSNTNKSLSIIEKSKVNLKKYLLQDTDVEVVENFLNILDFSGPDASLNCMLTNNEEFKVEKINFPEFCVNIHEDFNSVYFSTQNSSTKNYLTCVYDGYIERESEIFSLVEKSKQNNNSPVVLFCRGISDYAVSMIKQIMLKNKVYFYPYICKFDNNDPFLFEDIYKILNLKSYNIESGDNLHKSLSDNSDFRTLKLYSNKITIFKPDLKLQEEITEQLKITTDEDTRKYLFRRKNRCTPNNVFIQIPHNKVKDLNTYKSMIRSYNKITINGLLSCKDNIYSTFEYKMCKSLSSKLFKTINNIGYTIKINQNKEEIKQ